MIAIMIIESKNAHLLTWYQSSILQINEIIKFLISLKQFYNPLRNGNSQAKGIGKTYGQCTYVP